MIIKMKIITAMIIVIRKSNDDNDDYCNVDGNNNYDNDNNSNKGAGHSESAYLREGSFLPPYDFVQCYNSKTN